MREIKFRAWNKILNKVYSHEELKEASKNIVKDDFTIGIFLPLNSDNELMQFTGMVDKNGKEIYEGDIVKLVSNSFLNNGVDEVGIITYDKCEAMYCVEGFDGLYIDDFSNINALIGRTSIEVIGNRYENKDILEKYDFELP